MKNYYKSSTWEFGQMYRPHELRQQFGVLIDADTDEHFPYDMTDAWYKIIETGSEETNCYTSIKWAKIRKLADIDKKQAKQIRVEEINDLIDEYKSNIEKDKELIERTKISISEHREQIAELRKQLKNLK